jgi:hypothetical protein
MQCLNQTILGLFYKTHWFESRGPRQKKEKRRLGYHQYSSPALSRGPRAANSGTLDDSDSEAQWIWAQRGSISSLVRSVLYHDPSRSNSTSSSGNYDKVVVSNSRAPHRTPLMVVTLT